MFVKSSLNASSAKQITFNVMICLVLLLLSKQSPTFKFSRKASSSYSLRLESGRQKDQRNLSGKVTRRTNSTPASPSHGGHGHGGGHHHHASSGGGSVAMAGSGTASAGGGGREPQCTCMTPEQYARLRAQDPRFRGNSIPSEFSSETFRLFHFQVDLR